MQHAHALGRVRGRRLPVPALLAMAIPLIGLGALYTHPAFSDPWLSWIGLYTRGRPTFDHQPLLPWIGVVLCGLAAGKVAYPSHDVPLARWHSRAAPARLLAQMGRHSLLIYMAHVPILIGTMAGLRHLLR